MVILKCIKLLLNIHLKKKNNLINNNLYKFINFFQIPNKKWTQYTNNGKEKKNYLSNILGNLIK